MSKELVISANRHETKVALIEDDQLVEVYFQRANEYSLAGSIHKGRVTRVLPGMQSAFVDVGLERDTFLYVSDFLEEHEDFDKITGDERPGRDRGRERDRDRGRDRGRDQRDQRDAAPPPFRQQVPSSSESDGAGATETPVAEAAVVTTEPPAAGESAADGKAERPPQGEDRERRGRRSRRRRRGGHGFPDSKYARDAALHSSPAIEPGSLEVAEPGPDTETELIADPAPLSPTATVPPLILPGESLAKYRHSAPRNEAAPSPELVVEDLSANDAEPEDGDLDTVAEIEENEYDEPIHYPPENALPDAPLHARALDAPSPEDAELTVRLEELDARLASDEGAATLTAEAEELSEVSEHLDSEAEEQPAIASLLDDDEDRDIQAMILGDVEGMEIEQPEENTGATEVAAESGSASVRERGGRFPHRVSRSRRRGRPQGPSEAGDRERRDTAIGEAPRQELSRDNSNSAEPDREGQPRQERTERVVSRPNQGQPSISDLLKEGQEIIVQIAKEPLGPKGARITSHIALPGRYVVYMPTLEHMGVSRKIASDEERLRLKRILQAKRPGPVGGFITRTAAEGRTEDEIAGDMLFLYKLWQDIRTKAEKRPAPMMLHHDLDIVQRILRDQLADSFKAIWIDNEDTYESVLRFVERFQPALVPKVKLYTRDAPIFDAFNVTNELEKALRPKVWLKSGGFIVINQTEALVAIDVNTGKYVGKTNRLEDTIVKTNTEAIKEIVRQIRLRDLGGIIVIDFIDMDERKNRQKVMQTLEEAMRVDRAPYKILQFNDFGLVAITRKRVKQSLERTLCAPCPHCEGAGYVKSPQTVVGEILTEARKLAKNIQGKDVMLRVHPDVAKVLKSNQNKFLEELEELLRRPVLVKSDPQLHHEKFDLA
jgi:ribonuclease G